MNQGKWVFLGAAAVALACATGSGGAIAAPTVYVSSDYSTNDGLFAPTQTTRTATAGTSTSQLDGANFATATADASAGTVGIGMATTLPDRSRVSASAAARIQDQWTPCPTCLITIDAATVTFIMHFEGTLSPAWLAANAISGDQSEFSGSFYVNDAIHYAIETLDFAWDGSHLTGTFCNSIATPTCAPFTFASTTLADGSLSFDDNLSFTGALFAPGFGTELRLAAGWDSIQQPSTLAFLHTFAFGIVSSDPNLVWISDAGQVTQVSGVSAVSEPGTLPLVGLGLLVLAQRARKGQQRG